tara:strand:- start:16 stop:360 length:345 start_codon:yes stop_codon:yes gene_type:complete
LNLKDLIKLKTEYKSITIRSILLFALLILLFVIEIFVFWGIYGEGASASRISELWYVEIILDYLPIAIISCYLIFQMFLNYKQQKYIEFKTDSITLVILIVLFLMRNEIQQIIF